MINGENILIEIETALYEENSKQVSYKARINPGEKSIEDYLNNIREVIQAYLSDKTRDKYSGRERDLEPWYDKHNKMWHSWGGP